MHPVGPLFPAMILAILLVTTHLHPISRPPRDDYQTFQTEMLPSGSADDNVFRTLVEGNHQLQEQHFHYLGTPREESRQKRILAGFTRTRPSLYVKSSSNTRDFLNTYIRGNFRRSGYSFDRPRPLRWG
ncbi:hypothetical protein CDAR_519841 [Caerostris darwini]|uniref:Uncharacterized protein n=1 Tax=Caerostris darwini TaxID=1538125 RepID=A0AAV4TJV9_9ARAC|nr:hypothetical protein CDAR_519841 [Caerostris darwini]